MTTLPLPVSGRPKRDIIELAYEYCGSAGYEFGRTPEEFTSGLRHLETLMDEEEGNGLALGYNHALYGSGRLEELSNLARADVDAVSYRLAERLAPGLGVTLSPEMKKAAGVSWRSLLIRHASIPMIEQQMPYFRGAGNRHVRWVRTVSTDSALSEITAIATPVVVTPTVSPSLDFSVAGNSQYLALLFGI